MELLKRLDGSTHKFQELMKIEQARVKSCAERIQRIQVRQPTPNSAKIGNKLQSIGQEAAGEIKRIQSASKRKRVNLLKTLAQL